MIKHIPAKVSVQGESIRIEEMALSEVTNFAVEEDGNE